MTQLTQKQKWKVAAVQMVSVPDVAENLARADALIAEAVAAGAKLVGLPEYFCILGMRDGDKVAVRERDGDGPIQQFLAEAAARHKVWLIGGTVPLECPDPGKVWNTCLVHDDAGNASHVMTRSICSVSTTAGKNISRVAPSRPPRSR